MDTKSKLSQFRSKSSALDEKYSNRPMFHDKFRWLSNTGKSYNIKDIEDIHLINIFKMLVKSIDCLNESKKLYDEMPLKNSCFDKEDIDGSLMYFDNFISHIGYEIHLRGLFVEDFEIYKNIEDDKTKV